MCSSGDGVIAFIYRHICQNEWKKASGILIKMCIFIVEQDSVSFGFFNGLKTERYTNKSRYRLLLFTTFTYSIIKAIEMWLRTNACCVCFLYYYSDVYKSHTSNTGSCTLACDLLNLKSMYTCMILGY